MAKTNGPIALSPTVSSVIDKFTAAMHADETIDKAAADRLAQRLQLGSVPKADEIKTALFPPPTEVEP